VDLTPYARQQLGGEGIPAEDLEGAEGTIQRLTEQQMLQPCPAPQPPVAPTPAPGVPPGVVAAQPPVSAPTSFEPVPGRDCRQVP
jgi:hypothetical protein